MFLKNADYDPAISLFILKLRLNSFSYWVLFASLQFSQFFLFLV